ncbi:MAG: GTPase [Clostridia bacterium]|nr:GTPase [Clostridia bacterium]
MQIPVYLFTGFLEAGKTKFIQETMEDPRFNNGEKTLILMCEEGLEEYEPERFSADRVYVEAIENEEDLTPANLKALLKKHSAKRVLVEYNGMWMLSSLINALPDNWVVAQEFMFAQSSTIIGYNKNMRNLVVDKLQNCELVVFNRYSPDIDKMELHKIVRGVNTRADIAYEFPNGDVEYDEIEDPLPFDRDAAVITPEDKDYAYFYRDIAEHLDFYNGKTIKFKCVIAKNKELAPNQLVVGRHIMTCCVDDITFAGYLLVGDVDTVSRFESRNWAFVTAELKVEYNKLYGREGPVLYLKDIARTSPPEEEVATFY